MIRNSQLDQHWMSELHRLAGTEDRKWCHSQCSKVEVHFDTHSDWPKPVLCLTWPDKLTLLGLKAAKVVPKQAIRLVRNSPNDDCHTLSHVMQTLFQRKANCFPLNLTSSHFVIATPFKVALIGFGNDSHWWFVCRASPTRRSIQNLRRNCRTSHKRKFPRHWRLQARLVQSMHSASCDRRERRPLSMIRLLANSSFPKSFELLVEVGKWLLSWNWSNLNIRFTSIVGLEGRPRELKARYLIEQAK